ncbi:3-oxoacyl-reductase [Martensiomyces pterosporus]|nr:3-oxoacyl-reductase [Martensiomyces pterosporus]
MQPQTILRTATLAGKTALVTGATGGIGGAIAEELARRGARVVLSGRNTDKLSSLLDRLSGLSVSDASSSKPQPAKHCALACDIQNRSSIKALARAAIAQTPGVDILVNAAGISRDSLVVRQKDCDVAAMMETNLLGAMALCREIVPHMIRQKSGSIINVSSVIGIHGNTGQSAYAATKAGLIGFSKSLAKELGPRNIRVNAIAPGFIQTELTRGILEQPVTKALVDGVPLKRVGSVEDVAHGAAFLAEAQYVTGQVLVIDGGLFI